MKKCLFAFLILCVVTIVPVYAQTAVGSLSGTVRDDKGDPLAGASITAKNVETGFERSDVTAEGGTYRIASLPFGTYDVTASIQGFATQVQTDVRVDVARVVNLDFGMKLSATSEVMTVVSEAPLIERTESHVGTVVTPEQVENLPLNGRQFANLAALAPGTTLRFHPDPTKATVLAVSSVGGSGRNINFVVDGGDDNDDTVGGIIQFYSLESVAEFNYLQSRYKAEYGRSAGGVLNLVTKSGTNDLHGSGFLAWRDDSLNGKTPREEAEGLDKSPYSREQYGGSVGGPIVKDKAHFFVAFERLQLDQEDILSAGFLPQFDGLAVPLQTRDTLFTGKFTSNLDPRQYLTVRYGQQKTTNPYGIGSNYAPNARGDSSNTFHSLLASHNFVMSQDRLNEFTFQYSDFKNEIRPNSVDPTEIFPVSGFVIGQNPNTPQTTEQKKYQFRDDISWTWRNDHHFKAGIAYVHEPTLGGTFSTGTAAPSFTHLSDDPNSAISDIIQFGGEAFNDNPNNQYGFYFQDDWNFNDKLTLNLGVRYDYTNLANSLGDNGSQGPNTLCDALRALPYDFNWLREIKNGPADCRVTNDKNNIAPRVGFAYDWNADGKTVIRGGYGLYYDFPYVNANFLFAEFALNAYGIAYNRSVSTGILNPDGSFFNVGDPLPPSDPLPGVPPPNDIASPNFVVPYTHQASVGMSHQIGPNAAIDIDYVHTSVRDQFVRFSMNGVIDGQLLLPGYATGARGSRFWWNAGFSDYDGVSFTYRGRVREGIQVQASYTLSRAEGNILTGADEFRIIERRNAAGCRDCVLDFTKGVIGDPRQEGPLDTDARHRIVLAGIFDLPADFRLSGFFRGRSSKPFNGYAAVDDDGDGFAYSIVDDQVNAHRGAKNTQLDVRVSKFFNLGGDVRIEGIAEAFNLFNAENPDDFASDGTPRATAGDAGTGEQRVFSLGARIEF